MIGLVDGNNFFVSCERVVDPSLNGRAVAVLSNNDGCCVSRSNEFKALGIPMGTPYFRLKDREATGELVFRSSNYELYGDISRRIISTLREDAVEVEQYSIDEAFIWPPVDAEKDIMSYGKYVRAKVLQWTGIPCGVGFAPTKTLAKIANHIGKKRPCGVFVLPADATDILRTTPVYEVWGIGRQLSAKLRSYGIMTADGFRNMRDDDIRNIGGVTMLRTAMELRGVPCVEDKAYDADPDTVCVSRSFGETVATERELGEAMASFVSQAAEKLRRHRLLAGGCNIFAQFGAFDGHDYLARTVVFPEPTDATNRMLQAVRRAVGAVYVPDVKYRRCGVVFFGLEKADAPRQMDLFAQDAVVAPSKLYKVVDSLNARLGKNAVFSAAEGIGNGRKWKMKRDKLSKRMTTDWDELITVR